MSFGHGGSDLEREERRLRSLASYDVNGVGPERTLDAVARGAALALSAPVGFLTIVGRDRAWHKASHGAPPKVLPREQSLCSTVVASGAPLVVPDLAGSPAWSRHAQTAADVRAYAGMPVVGHDGLPLGALCVTDTAAREFSAEQLDALTDLADVAAELLDLRRRDHPPTGNRRSLSATADHAPLRGRDVLRALEDGEFVVHYQPIVELPGGGTTGVEALVRWDLPGAGLIGPAAFLPYVESSEVLSEALRDFVLDRALSDLARWRQPAGSGGAVARDLTVSVNVSGSAVRAGGLREPVLDALRRHAVPPAALTIEITETASLGDLTRAAAELRRVRESGVRLALDDFGIGYNGLELIGLLPLDVIKLDRAFVGSAGSAEAVGEAGRMAVILGSTVALAAQLGLEVVAEGIEHAHQRAAMVDLGVRLAQGFHFHEPMAADRIETLLGLPPGGPLPGRRATARPASPRDPGDHATALSTIVRMHAAGASPHTIAAALNQRGLPRPGGLRWHSAVVARMVCRGSDDPAWP